MFIKNRYVIVKPLNLSYKVTFLFYIFEVVSWCGGTALTSSAGRPICLDKSMGRPTTLAVGSGGGCFDGYFLSLSALSSSSLSLGDDQI